MMGRQHALAGASTWLAVLPAVNHVMPLTAGQAILGTVLATGAALIPDWDQPGSLISRTYGPITNVIAHLVAFIARGHRKGTHSLLGLLVTLVVATLIAAATGPALAVTTWILLGTAARGLGITDVDGLGTIRGGRGLRYVVGAIVNAFIMAVVTAVVLWTGVDVAAILPAAVIAGAASHIATDGLTDHGVPLLYPFSRRRYGIRLITTGSRRSTRWVTLLLALLTVALAYVDLAVA